MKRTMKIWTPQGVQTGVPNGLAQKGEGLWDPSTNDVQYIDEGKEGVDDQPVRVKDETFIPSNQLGFDKMLEPYMKHISSIQDKQRRFEKNSKYDSLSKQTAKIQNTEVDKYINQTIRPVAQLQAAVHETQQYNCGKIPKFDGGHISAFNRAFPTIAGLTAAIGQLMHWGGNKIRYNNTYAQNPYGTRALTELNQLRYNPYTEIQASQDAERRAAYANSQSGGMTGGQRYLGRIGLGIGAMRNAANIYANAQQQNNALRANYANALLQEGNAIAQRRQNAAQHDWADFVAAHGAKTRGIEQSTANILNSINSGFQNEFKYRTWQDTLNIYNDQQKLDRERLKADIALRKAGR